MWDPPGPRIELTSPTLAAGFSTTGPPGKSRSYFTWWRHHRAWAASEPGGPASTLPLPTTGSFQVQQREISHSPSAFSPKLWMNCYRVIFIWLWCYLNIDSLWKQQMLDQSSESFFQSLLEGESKYFVQVHGEWKQKQDIRWRVLLCGNSVGLKPGRVSLVESINRSSQWGDMAHKARP